MQLIGKVYGEEFLSQMFGLFQSFFDILFYNCDFCIILGMHVLLMPFFTLDHLRPLILDCCCLFFLITETLQEADNRGEKYQQ